MTAIHEQLITRPRRPDPPRHPPGQPDQARTPRPPPPRLTTPSTRPFRRCDPLRSTASFNRRLPFTRQSRRRAGSTMT